MKNNQRSARDDWEMFAFLIHIQCLFFFSVPLLPARTVDITLQVKEASCKHEATRKKIELEHCSLITSGSSYTKSRLPTSELLVILEA